MVLIYLGSNDYWKQPDPSGVLSAIKTAGITRCRWVGPPLIRGARGAANEHLRRAVERDGTCSYFDSTELKLVLRDGVHPTYDGHVAWLRAAIKGL